VCGRKIARRVLDELASNKDGEDLLDENFIPPSLVTDEYAFEGAVEEDQCGLR